MLRCAVKSKKFAILALLLCSDLVDSIGLIILCTILYTILYTTIYYIYIYTIYYILYSYVDVIMI